MTDLTQQEIEAAHAGLNFKFRKGDVFRGAFPEAQALGYERGTLAYKLFITGYIRAIKEQIGDSVPIDKDDRII